VHIPGRDSPDVVPEARSQGSRLGKHFEIVEPDVIGHTLAEPVHVLLRSFTPSGPEGQLQEPHKRLDFRGPLRMAWLDGS
jgi:hypothetical protein